MKIKCILIVIWDEKTVSRKQSRAFYAVVSCGLLIFSKSLFILSNSNINNSKRIVKQKVQKIRNIIFFKKKLGDDVSTFLSQKCFEI